MSDIRGVLSEIHKLDELTDRKLWINQIHPLLKLGVTVAYLVTVTSFSRYDLFGVLSMFIYLFIGFNVADLSFRQCLRRIRLILPLILMISIANPIFDQNQILLGFHVISAGLISMVVLWVKGIYCVIGGYLLIATTSIENICYALECIHVPDIIVTQILLTYRYISLLLQQVHQLTQAYALRAPKQKGINYKSWGPLVGQLLLRSIDRSNEVYESMTLRGYHGSFAYMKGKNKLNLSGFLYFGIWILIFFLLRRYPVLVLLGTLFGG